MANMGDGGMSNMELLQAVAEINWAQSDDSKMFEKLATFRVGHELYQRMSGHREVETLRQETIASIAKYVKDNPKAKKEDLQKEISKQIIAFAEKVERM